LKELDELPLGSTADERSEETIPPRCSRVRLTPAVQRCSTQLKVVPSDYAA
jgi:hypothetical protein